MSKHTRAEWYRLIHSGHYFSVFILLTLGAYATLFALDAASIDILNKSLSENVGNFLETFSALLPLLICTIAAAALGNMFLNRTAYYEIMDGSSIHKIILSKLVVYCSLVLIFTIVPLGGFFTYIGLKNGAGEMKNIPLFALLSVIVILHLISATVMTTLLAQNIILGSCIPYIRYLVFEQVALVMLAEGADAETADKFEKAYNWFASLQITRLAWPEYPKDFIIAVIASFVIEFIILYAAVYATYRKKLFR